MTRQLTGPALFLVFFTFYGIYAWQIPLLPFEQYEVVDSSTMPKLYAMAGALFSFLAIVSHIIKSKEPQGEQKPLGITKHTVRQTAIVMLLMVIYSALLDPLGFIVATLIFLISGFWVMGERRARIVLFASVPMVVFFWLLMNQLLNIYLAPGSLWS